MTTPMTQTARTAGGYGDGTDVRPVEDYECCLRPSPGWLDISLATLTMVEVRELAADLVQEFDASRLTPEARQALERKITDLAYTARWEDVPYAAAYFDADGTHRASLEVEVYGPGNSDHDHLASQFLLRDRKWQPIAEPTVESYTHALGPALRVHRWLTKRERLLRTSRIYKEVVMHALQPEVNEDLIAVVGYCHSLATSHRFVSDVDAMAASLTLSPYDGRRRGGDAGTESDD